MKFHGSWQLKIAGLLFLASAVTFAQTAESTLTGFSAASSKTERADEQTFLRVPNADRARADLKILTEAPHMAGSEADKQTAEYVLRQFRSYGLDASIEAFPAELSEPVSVKFQILSPIEYSGPHPEFVAADPASKDARTSVGFIAYSSSGDVTANVVYVNYGMSQDYDLLRAKGISVEGKIVIARYGRCYRGAKAMAAEKNKAAGLIIYSDPQQDGYHAGDVYPNGPWRPDSGVQRGSALYDFIYPGVLADGSTVPHIPIMPMSYGDARHILENLAGPVAPRSWQGGLPFPYHLGPGPVNVRLNIKMSTPRRTIWDVVARIPGTQKPEGMVIAGNHRDAWVYGASDPSSGTAAMLEMARGLGVLLKQGWHPRRSIVMCSWDAEEPSEFGSTDWAEKHGAELTDKAVAYFNLDSAVSGDDFSVAATPSLKKFVKETAADVPDPRGDSLYDRANQQLREGLLSAITPGSSDGQIFGSDSDPSALDKLQPISTRTISIDNLGGGTDHVAFFDHFGIPSTDFGFGGANGVYHSTFDDFRWMEKFGDPQFLYHVAAARFFGLETLRMAQADLLPLDYEEYGREVQTYLDEVHEKLILTGQGAQLDFGPVRAAAQKFSEAGRDLDRHYEAILTQSGQTFDFYPVNRALVNAEKSLLLPDGLPGRPWFKNAIFAPAYKNGYAPVVLPGVLESADAGKWEQARQQLQALTTALNRASQVLQQGSQSSR